MACLALSGLGATEEQIAHYYESYCERLSPLENHIYKEQLHRFLEMLSTSDIRTVLTRFLPELISGWVRDAYHPIIRIAYGFEFDIIEEVAAGLAYLSICGRDPRIEELAANASQGQDPNSPFQCAQEWNIDFAGARTFTAGVERVVAHPKIEEAALRFDSSLRSISRCALEVFATTHNFFALHLVTSAHAFRLLHEFAGPHADGIFTLGVIAGYAVVEAPKFAPLADLSGDHGDITTRDLLGMCRDDEHDYKLAYSAWQQASYWNDATYVSVAVDYLQRQ